MVSLSPALLSKQGQRLPPAAARPTVTKQRYAVIPHREMTMPSDRNRISRLTTEGPGRAPNRAMLRAVGFHDDDFDRPMIGVASLFSDITPCNAHLDRLARHVCEGVRAGGG